MDTAAVAMRKIGAGDRCFASPCSRLAEGSASHGLEITPDAFQPMKLNAFRPNDSPGLFNAALTVNWFQHIPRQILPQWIRRLHRKLVPGSIVMIGVNHLTGAPDHDCSPARRDPESLCATLHL